MQDRLALPQELSDELLSRDGVSEVLALFLVLLIAIAVGSHRRAHRGTREHRRTNPGLEVDYLGGHPDLVALRHRGLAHQSRTGRGAQLGHA